MSVPAETIISVSPETGTLEPGRDHAPRITRIAELRQQINLRDMHSILLFGAKAQEPLSTLSEQMLDDMKNKESGEAGKVLNDMVATLRGFDAAQLDEDAKPSWLDRLVGKSSNLARALQRYESVRDQVEAISIRMDQHQTALMTDIESLERLYHAGTDYLRDIEDYIAAGEQCLEQIDNNELPMLRHRTNTDHNTLASQRLRDMQTARDQLDRRVHDLKLSRQVLLQNLPAIRLIQENDRSLVGKIQSTLVNTLPLWKQQLAQGLTIQRSRNAAATLGAATDLTNDLLSKNAETLKQANREVRVQTERGIFDIESIEQANRYLIDTINESIDIAEQGQATRKQASARIQQLEKQLSDSLNAASLRMASLEGKTHTTQHKGANWNV